MNLFFNTHTGTSFVIEVDNSDTLLLVKQKIEKSQNIPVSKQVLVVNGAVMLREDLNVEQCQIVQESHLQVLVSPEENPNHNNDDQVLQPEQSPAPFISAEEYFWMQDWPLMKADEMENIYSFTPRKKRKIYSYQPVTAPPSSNSVQENTNVQDSTIAVRVSLPYSAESFLLSVNKTDHVGTLRTLIRNGLGDQTRLRDGYFLMHKERVLCEDMSFQLNGIGHFDTIEIVPIP